jgi:Domain of unknown function (DUF4412)
MFRDVSEAIDEMRSPLDLHSLVRCCVTAAALCASAIGGSSTAFAQDITGAYVLVGDSDGTKPRTGARLELTFSGATTGSVQLYAVRTGETVRDAGKYSIANHQITIHFKEVDWAAESQPYFFDGCTLTLPFLAVSSATGPGTSAWQRKDPKCSGQQGSVTPAQAEKPLAAFSADETITRNGRAQKVKVYATDKALRSESEENGGVMITIARLDLNAMWILNPQTKTYTETDLNLRGGATLVSRDSLDPGCSITGEEQIGAYHCQKQTCHQTIKGKDYVETSWAARELGGMTIRYVNATRTMEMENLKPGPQDAKLFEIPAGYRKASR